ncbi:putative c repressor [Pseudomonas chlororaphis subsp. aurantiaca]|uniref:XRE family transcriptional regulator n=1 Tax=Pseudomonas chlororaphis TaxID=587753 RepID=UPI000865C374|nr:S24 family peptidase [Pseudomonas chlororaphis]BAV74151.1 putative c repressor [Pseudomonas chlororaphis subsp. aurantiaca]
MGYRESDETDVLTQEHPNPGFGIGCFKDRLKAAVKGESLRGFSRSCGLSEATLRSYLSGDTYPTLDRLEMIAGAAKVSPMELAFGQALPSQHAVEGEIYSYVPLYDAKCSAGHGAWSDDARILTRLAFTTYSLRKQGLSPANLSAIRVDGDSMEGLLSDGDTVLIDHSRATLEGEAVYVIRLDDHLYAKRLQRQFDGAVSIISQNKEYQAMTVPKERLGDLEIIGRVVWAGGWL